MYFREPLFYAQQPSGFIEGYLGISPLPQFAMMTKGPERPPVYRGTCTFLCGRAVAAATRTREDAECRDSHTHVWLALVDVSDPSVLIMGIPIPPVEMRGPMMSNFPMPQRIFPPPRFPVRCAINAPVAHGLRASLCVYVL